MQTFPYTVGQTVEDTTFLAIATSWEYPTCQIVLTRSDMSGYTTLWYETTDGSVFNTEQHETSEDATIKFVELAFNFSI